LSESAISIDLLTVLARLLSDPALREAFVRDRDKLATDLRVRSGDRAAFLQLLPDDLEFQARVLLRKRFDLALSWIPATVSLLGNNAWPLFEHFARTQTGSGIRSALQDAHRFACWLRRRGQPTCDAEFGRLQFTLSNKRCALRFSRLRARRPVFSLGLQLLLRIHRGVHEFHFYLKP
jgi:hypothetical protein